MQAVSNSSGVSVWTNHPPEFDCAMDNGRADVSSRSRDFRSVDVPKGRIEDIVDAVGHCDG